MLERIDWFWGQEVKPEMATRKQRMFKFTTHFQDKPLADTFFSVKTDLDKFADELKLASFSSSKLKQPVQL